MHINGFQWSRRPLISTIFKAVSLNLGPGTHWSFNIYSKRWLGAIYTFSLFLRNSSLDHGTINPLIVYAVCNLPWASACKLNHFRLLHGEKIVLCLGEWGNLWDIMWIKYISRCRMIFLCNAAVHYSFLKWWLFFPNDIWFQTNKMNASMSISWLISPMIHRKLSWSFLTVRI